MSAPITDKPDRYALLIGIDCYLPNKLPGGAYYPNLMGCVRDVSLMEAFLKNKLNLPENKIFKLTASNNDKGPLPLEPRSLWPTYENIVAAFKKVTELATSGDQVYIHYAGHGGRAPTIFKDRKGENGIDEALVPTDIGSSKARYLRDMELVKLLNDMVAKGLVVAVVLDCCHSGGMTRGGGNVGIRGIGIVDSTPRPTESLIGTSQDLLAAWDLATDGGTRSVTMGSGWLPEPNGYTMLAACLPSESAYEYAFDGKERNGALTYWLLNSLQDAGPGLSYKLLHDRIVAKVHSQFEKQTPQLQGEGDRTFFGSEVIQPYYAAPVMKVDKVNKRILIGAGQVHGLRKGARFAIYPHGSDFSKPDLRQAVVELSDLGSTDSWFTTLEQFTELPTKQGSQAVLLSTGSVKLVQKVWLDKQPDLPKNIDQDTALNAIALALPNNSWIEIATRLDQIDYNIAINAQEEYEIWDRSGQMIQNLRPALKLNTPGSATRVVGRLIHLAKYNAIKQLINHDTMSPLVRKLVVELVGKRAEYDPNDPYEPDENISELGYTPVLKVGEWIGLRIKNTSTQRLKVTAFDLQPDWGIKQIFPRGAGDFFVEFEPNQELILPLHADLPEDCQDGKDVIKVFATVSTTNLRWLELPILDQSTKHSSVGTRGGSGPANHLEQLLAAFSAEQPPTRSLTTVDYPSHGWVTAQVEVNIKKVGEG